MPKDPPRPRRHRPDWLFDFLILTVFAVCGALAWFLVRLVMILCFR